MMRLSMIWCLLTALLAGAALSGCGAPEALIAPKVSLAAAGLVEDANEARRLEKLKKAMTDQEIANVLDVDIRAQLPTSLAVASLTGYGYGGKPELAQVESDELAAWQRLCASHPEIREVRAISELMARSDLGSGRLTLRSLRMAAAKMQCELLLVYLRGDSHVENTNDAAALYLTLVGLWLVPGNTLEHQTIMQAALVDCRTGMILGTAIGDARQKVDCTAMSVDRHRDKLTDETAAEARKKLQTSCGATLQGAISRAKTGK